MGSQKIKKPYGGGTTIVSSVVTGNVDITVNDSFTYLDLVTNQATGNRTVRVTIGANVALGDRIYVKTKTQGTETTAFTTGCSVATLTGQAGKTYHAMLVYDGTAFTEEGTPLIK